MRFVSVTTTFLCFAMIVLAVSVEAQNDHPVVSETTSSFLNSEKTETATREVASKKAVARLPRAMFVDIWQSEIDIDEVLVPMVGELKSRIAKGAAVAVGLNPVKIFRIQSKDEDRELGHALILDEVGKYRPITFLVALDSKDRVLDLQVLVYREHIGKAIESKRFTRQFRNKSGTSQLKLHRDIRNLAGATLSARASVRAVRRALATIDETVRTGMSLDWQRNVANDLLSVMAGIAEVEEDLEKETSDSMSKPVTRARPAMGTILRIEAYGENAAIGIAAAFDEVERIEALLSRWKSDSDVIRVESAPVGTPVFVSSTTLECVQLALSAARESGGAFDPTLVSQGYQKVLVDMEASTITLESENLILDLGGIGKGYALDRAAQILEQHAVHSVLLDFGGQLLALDPPPEQSGWDVGIFDPRNTGTLLGSVALVRASLATSSDYERGDHIVDPLLGKVAAVSLSTTILAQNATRADSMSTTLAVLGPEHAQRLIDKVAGGAAVILVAGEDSPRILGDLPH